jgi:hypothetical protein
LWFGQLFEIFGELVLFWGPDPHFVGEFREKQILRSAYPTAWGPERAELRMTIQDMGAYGSSWGAYGSSWGAYGSSWGAYGSSWGAYGSSWGAYGSSWALRE